MSSYSRVRGSQFRLPRAASLLARVPPPEMLLRALFVLPPLHSYSAPLPRCSFGASLTAPLAPSVLPSVAALHRGSAEGAGGSRGEQGGAGGSRGGSERVQGRSRWELEKAASYSAEVAHICCSSVYNNGVWSIFTDDIIGFNGIAK